MAYRTIDPRMWDDDKFLALSADSRLAWIYLLTGPHVTSLPGLSVAGIGSLSDGLRLPFERLSKAMRELIERGLIEVDEAHRVIRVPNATKYNRASNPKVLKGWFNLWSALPECALKDAHAAGIRQCFGDDAKMVKVWDQTFGKAIERLSKASPKASPKAFRSPEPEPDQEPEPEPAGAVAPGGGLFKDLPTTNPPSVESVWRHFAAGSPKSILTPDRKKLIASWLVIYPEADLHRTIDGYRASAFHNGDNDSGKKHLSLELMFRDAKHIEDGWNLAPGGRPPSRPVPAAFQAFKDDDA